MADVMAHSVHDQVTRAPVACSSLPLRCYALAGASHHVRRTVKQPLWRASGDEKPRLSAKPALKLLACHMTQQPCDKPSQEGIPQPIKLSDGCSQATILIAAS